MKFSAGHSQGVTFKVDGGPGPAITLAVTGHNFNEEVADLVTTHSGSGGVQARIPGILDVKGTVEANVDADSLPAGMSIRAGAKGVFTMMMNSVAPAQLAAMILRVNYRSVVNGLVSYSFDIGID